jgi:hypothetical protein
MLSLKRFIQILNAFDIDPAASCAPAGAARPAQNVIPTGTAGVPGPRPGTSALLDHGTGVCVARVCEEIPAVRAGDEFITPLGKRRLQIVRFVGGGKRAKVYQAIEAESRQVWALKVIHERTPANLQSMALENEKAQTLATHQLPHARIIEMGATYALKEWVEGIEGNQWLDAWKEDGADPSDSTFRALVGFFREAAIKGVHINDLKPPNMMVRGGTEWVPIDPGLITAPVPTAVAMKRYRDRFVRRWLRADRSRRHGLLYWLWCLKKSVKSVD